MSFVSIRADAGELCENTSSTGLIEQLEDLMLSTNPSSCRELQENSPEPSSEAVRACIDDRFNQCFPDLSPTIDTRTVSSLFTELIADPNARQFTGGGACYVRAAYAAQFLASRGISARKVFIQDAPTLIAFDLGDNNQPNGNFYDYGGYHAVVEVNVLEANGEVVPYILDTQFMQQPIPRNEYFRRTIGQECLQTTSPRDSLTARSALNCYFQTEAQNVYAHELENSHDIESLQRSIIDPPPLDSRRGRSLQCGWTQLVDSVPFSDADTIPPSLLNEDKQLRIMNRENLPPGFNSQSYKPGVERDLILQAYREQLRPSIEENISMMLRNVEYSQRQLERNRYLFEEDRQEDLQVSEIGPQMIEIWRQDLEAIDQKIIQVESTLMSTYGSQQKQ